MPRPAPYGKFRFSAIIISLAALIVASSCLPKSPSESGGGINITVYGFSIMKESLEKAIYPAFSAKWKNEHGADVRFTSSFAGSETITNQILQGVKAQIAILSIDRDAKRLKDGGFVTSDWHAMPQKGIVNKDLHEKYAEIFEPEEDGKTPVTIRGFDWYDDTTPEDYLCYELLLEQLAADLLAHSGPEVLPRFLALYRRDYNVLLSEDVTEMLGSAIGPGGNEWLDELVYF